MTTYYCSLADARRELRADATVDDDRLLQLLAMVAARIDNEIGIAPWFEPYVEEHEMEIEAWRVDSWRRTLSLDRPLLDFDSVTISGHAPTATIAAYPTRTPYKALRISDCCYTWYNVACPDCEDVPPYVAEIVGTWGYRTRYDTAWWHADDITNAGGINAAATTMTVADADGIDKYGLIPRFSPGQLIAVTTAGATEFMRVTAVNATTNTITMNRAENGTTAAAHNLGDDISIFYPEDDIRRGAARQAALLYARQGAFQVETIEGIGVITYPQDLLTELRNTLRGYMHEYR